MKGIRFCFYAFIAMLFASIVLSALPASPIISFDNNEIDMRFENIQINIFQFIMNILGFEETPEEQPPPCGIICCSPHDCTVNAGQILSFSVHFLGDGDSSFSVYWEYLSPGSEKWTVSEADSASSSHLHYIAEPAYSGRLYHAVVQNNTTGEVFVSNPALLVVNV